ncbi:putative aldouronate transport system permease protein [Paenibacillus sp. V4I3]|uniref:carbohydrate ABC transporter permease n=1 Tax=unclassified Paenibacillus TaxID=185978 RepID=UPI002781295A|nr:MULTISPECIES: carbohydrate ABC transporter permease [unclassified Paenibacillus]MDQ0877778.1 putative aldouronate transport system permease protein [Paenibacillus sp. V4I3]MDQ0886349.1 putative aldouronate transport system permease protein [Paenibacillus sp. V4I9]
MGTTTARRIRMEPILFHTINGIFMLVLAIVTLYPFLHTLTISFNEGNDALRGGIYIWPRSWSLQNYKAIFLSGTIYHAAWISVARTITATVIGVFLTTMLAYTLAQPHYIFRKIIGLIFVLTMYFNAGLIPNYFLIKSLGLLNNFWVYVLPGMVNAFNLIVIRTYIRTLPSGLVESAKMDGAGDFTIFIRIIFPLCTPVLATIALFIAVGSWNSWFDTFLYASSDLKLSTLQYEMMKLLGSTMSSNNDPGLMAGANTNQTKAMVTPASIRSAITIVAAVPILFVYPFLQKYFIVGMNLGSVKE